MSARTPKPHQEQALEYAHKNTNFGLTMQMRLGKTLIAIWYAQRNKSIKRILVTAPLTVLGAWRRELSLEEEIYLDLREHSQRNWGDLLERAWNSEHRIWVIANHSTVRIFPQLGFIPWDFVVLDESSVIRNKTKLSAAFLKGFRNSKHRAILNGNVAPENYLDLFNQFAFLYGSFMGCKDWWDFRKTYFCLDRYDWFPKPGMRKKIKQAFHTTSFVMTRKDAGVGSEKVFERRYVPLNKLQKEIYSSIIKRYAYKRADGSWNETQWAVQVQTWLTRLVGGFCPDANLISDEKIKEILYLLSSELKNEQIVIWFKFRAELGACLKALQQASYRCAVVHGGITDPYERDRAVESFSQRKSQLFLATEACAMRGLDCSVSDTAIYYSREWSCEKRAQSEDRIVSPLQKQPKLIIDLLTEHTIDEEVLDALNSKKFEAEFLLRKHVKTERLRLGIKNAKTGTESNLY